MCAFWVGCGRTSMVWRPFTAPLSRLTSPWRQGLWRRSGHGAGPREDRGPQAHKLKGERKAGGEAGIRTLGRAFGPYNGLANRRLQPLGHLTVLRKFSIRQGATCEHPDVSAVVPETVPARTGTGGPGASWPQSGQRGRRAGPACGRMVCLSPSVRPSRPPAERSTVHRTPA